MAYNTITYESILQRMIKRATDNYPDLDTREGSIIFNALAPAALELAIMYTELYNVLRESFVNTASREYLLTACEQMGMDISVFNANFSVHKGVFNIEVPIGSRWNYDLYNFVVSEYVGLNDDDDNYEYLLTCETSGTSSNSLVGDLTPITFTTNDLNYAKLVECVIEGENETSDDDIRQAYYDFVNSVAVDGNTSQYKRWCDEYDGIGNSKIIPLWNGNNTVKVSILSASNRAASEELIAEFQNYLDPGSTGMGDGKAPIGSIVTVSTATEKPIAVGATIHMKPGYTDTTPIDDAISKYFSEIAYKKNVVSYMNVGSVILSVNGVESVDDLYLDADTANITLGEEEIPVLLQGVWSVV